MSKKRFNTSRICSSDNYKLSKEIHKEYIIEQHYKNHVIVEQITSTTCIKKKAYVRCFGKLMPVTQEEITKIENSVNIIWK